MKTDTLQQAPIRPALGALHHQHLVLQRWTTSLLVVPLPPQNKRANKNGEESKS